MIWWQTFLVVIAVIINNLFMVVIGIALSQSINERISKEVNDDRFLRNDKRPA